MPFPRTPSPTGGHTISEEFNDQARDVESEETGPADGLGGQALEPPSSLSESSSNAMPLEPGWWVDELRRWQPPEQLASVDCATEFEVEDLIPARKVGALVAAGGTGKTTFYLNLFVHGATGRKFLDRDVRPGTYALLSSDDSQEALNAALTLVVQSMRLTDAEEEQVRRRVRLHSLQGLQGDRTFTTFQYGSAVSTNLPSDIVESLRLAEDLRIVALDTLRQFSGGSTNDEQVVKLSIAGAEDVARQLGCAVVLSHHTGKNNFRDGVNDMYAGSGSAAIADNCRFVLLLQTARWSEIGSKVNRTGQERGDPLVLQSTRGNLLMKPSPPIYLCRDEFRMDLISGEVLTKDQVRDKMDLDILKAVQAGCAKTTEIKAAVKFKSQAVGNAIKDLEARGHLQNNGGARASAYRLTASGSRHLQMSL